jgi:tRNA isopentenyl-2-thiomethyl-A-37 hydroxylase MiaE
MGLLVSDLEVMSMTLGYAIALAEARSCLAALADTATDFDESIHFEQMLLELDGMHMEDFPALSHLVGDRAELLRRLEAAVDRMLDLGGDSLMLELLLFDALGD